MGAVDRRVVITGIGVASAVGVGVEAFWDALEAGSVGTERIQVDGLPPIAACPVGPIDAEARFGRRELRRMDRVSQLAGVAAALALEDAGDLGLERERVGVVVGSAHGGAGTLDAAFRTMLERGADRMTPFAIPLSLPNAPAATTARLHDLRGPSGAPSTACAAGSDAIGLARSIIREGRAEAMLAGGADAPLVPFVVSGYARLGALSLSSRPAPEVSRPFDRARDGFVMGEGAGLLVLEEREHALARGARIYAEVAGYGSGCDAGHITDPDPTGTGPARAMRIALEDAGRDPSEVGYVNAHATSTPAGDAAEARAIAAAGLGHALVSSTKAMHGHTLGGAGGVEAAAAILPLVRGVLPPAVNLDDPEPDPPLRFVPPGARADVNVSLSNSFGFGGHNACLAFTQP
jgi:3-oxoacyl-[acyl-carrier-protein] synthase II